jgi:hypothetical protein
MNKTWRKHPFVIGKSYRVLSDFQSAGWTFSLGEVLRYAGNAYSRYDGVTGFFFHDASGNVRSVTLADDFSDLEGTMYLGDLFEVL